MAITEQNPGSRFVEFLKSKFENNRGEQAKAARKIGLSQTAFSRWVAGISNPDFESCLRLAWYCKISPLDIFEMAGLDSFAQLFRSFFPDHAASKQPTIEDMFPDPHHARVHAALQDIMENFSANIAERTAQIIFTFHSIEGLRKNETKVMEK